MTPQELRYAELVGYVNNPKNRKMFPRCVKVKLKELERLEKQLNYKTDG